MRIKNIFVEFAMHLNFVRINAFLAGHSVQNEKKTGLERSARYTVAKLYVDGLGGTLQAI